MPVFNMTGKESPVFESLDQFTQGYIEAAFWVEEESLTESMGENMPGVLIDTRTMESSYASESVPSFEMLAPDALASIVDDCTRFQRDNAALLERAGDASQNGQDFYLTRNRCGAGFWDRGYSESIGEKLTQAAQAFRESSLYLGMIA